MPDRMDPIPESTMRREDWARSGTGDPLRAHLFVILECGRPLVGGSRHSLADVDVVQFGRGTKRRVVRDGRTLTVTIPDAMMSSTHARMVRAGGWALQDTESKNGSLVNGALVRAAHLQDSSLIELGATFFAVRWYPTPSDAAPDQEIGPSDAATRGMETLVPPYAAALSSLHRVMASGSIPILFLGDTGTGKELLARAAHEASGRAGAFVAVNCGGIPETLVESQLFGHVRGAFSGAVRDEPGLIRSSDGGTLFLDEVGDLPPSCQAALLRVLQEGEVQSVGAARPAKVDLRVVAATHRRIDAQTQTGFRSDLYARLAGYVHDLPRLSERREDMGIIVATLLGQIAAERGGGVSLTPEAGRALLSYAWPRNVRELRHALAAAVVLANDGRIRAEHLQREIRDGSAPAARTDGPKQPEDTRGEPDALRDALVQSLTEHAGNVSEVARAMGKTRMQIHRWMRRFNIVPEDFRSKR